MRSELSVNGESVPVEVPTDTWVLRDELGLTGTKFGCGMGSEAPREIRLHLQPPSFDVPPGGVGEPGLPPIGGTLPPQTSQGSPG
jgi:hypothetical protein